MKTGMSAVNSNPIYYPKLNQPGITVNFSIDQELKCTM